MGIKIICKVCDNEITTIVRVGLCFHCFQNVKNGMHSEYKKEVDEFLEQQKKLQK